MNERLYLAFLKLGLSQEEALRASRADGCNPQNGRTEFPGQPCGSSGTRASNRTNDFMDIER